jgi:hypothetical protein
MRANDPKGNLLPHRRDPSNDAKYREMKRRWGQHTVQEGFRHEQAKLAEIIDPRKGTPTTFRELD